MTEGLKYEDIQVKYRTGRYVKTSGSGRDAQGYYRRGFMTKIGDLDEKTWLLYAETLIKENGDKETLANLEEFFADVRPWIRHQKDVHQYAMEFLLLEFIRIQNGGTMKLFTEDTTMENDSYKFLRFTIDKSQKCDIIQTRG